MTEGRKVRCEITHPGETEWTSSEVRIQGNAVFLDVPLRRGCALVKLHFE